MSRPVDDPLLSRRGTLAPVFAALGDPTRLSLIMKLCGGAPCSISKLTEDTQLTRQAITKHLRVLQHARLVSCTRSGRESRFAFDPEPVNELRHYLDLVSRQWDDALARLRSFVEN